MSCPLLWSTAEVVAWGRSASLSEEIIAKIVENDVDGMTLLTLTKDEIRTELEIWTLPFDHNLWDLIENLRAKQLASDRSAALELHEAEIEIYASSRHPMIDNVVVNELRRDAALQKQLVKDNILIHKDICEFELARQEQQRHDVLLAARSQAGQAPVNQPAQANPEIPNFFRFFTARSQSGQAPMSQPAQANSRITNLFGFRITDKINLVEAFGTGKVKSKVPQPEEFVRDHFATLSLSGGKLREKWEQEPFGPAQDLLDRCSVCFEKNVYGYQLPCDHCQCHECLERLFKLALRDVSLLPLQCCEVPIDMEIAAWYLEEDEKDILIARLEELRAKEKMFCPSCNQFINLDLIDRSRSTYIRCKCGTPLCTACKTVAHFAQTCQQNQSARQGEDKLLLEVSKKEGWKQCPSCKIMIELQSGCNHMTCSFCRHEFCYLCLNGWNKYSGRCASGVCEVWDEGRLLVAGEARVRAQEANHRQALPEPVREVRLAQAIEGLRGNEVCNHDWRRRQGRLGDCERCGYYLPCYGMICHSTCGATVCYTCAHHRIPQRGWR